MGNIFYFQWEIAFIKWIQYNSLDLVIMISKLFSILSSEVVLSVLIMLVYLALDKNLGRKVMINTLVALGFGCAIKSSLRRLRPYFVTDEIKCLAPVDNSADAFDIAAQGYSFPSLHSLNACCITGSLYKFTRKKGWLIFAIVFTFGIGLTRIVTANHFPTDVLVGWAIGAIAVELIPAMINKFGKNRVYIAIMLAYLCCFVFCRANDFYTSYGIMSGFFFADMFDEKYVNFKETHNLLRIIVRIIFGLLIFLVMVEGIKIIIPSTIPEDSMLSFIVRTVRYGLGIFVTLGLYPKLFEKNIFKFKD
ncbi:MAG: phosphatase PAP2 family protein [Firmicutes bacterium]|nr:phosphatase PAP2 family protein [Candidatus Colivicinus equi]